ncbi:unnamed protein product [Orchesella dallaii]|uniref:Uncharacterized protein n=1 Tax=Orchesella dallaii TaxID=48710 RepID=A0ABP1QBX4_9HEXA
MSSVITIQSTEELFSPSTLQEICRVYCSSNVKALLLASPKKNRAAENAVPENSKLNKSVQLPVQVWEGLLNDYHGVPEDYFPLLLAVLKNAFSFVKTSLTSKSRKNLGLKNIHLPNTTTLTDVRLRLVMANYPFSIDIHNCPALTKKAVTIINEFGQNLECLNIGNSTHILPIDVDTWIAKLIKGKRIPYSPNTLN